MGDRAMNDLVFSPATIGSILYLAVLGSVVAFAGYFWLLRKITAVKISLIAFVTPLIAMFLGYAVLQEVLSTHDYAGAAMVLAGVLIVQTEKQ